jgi:lysozyme family protein
MKDRSLKINAADSKITASQEDARPAAANRSKKTVFDKMLNSSIQEISSRPMTFRKTLFDPNIQLIPSYSTTDAGFRGSLALVMRHEGTSYVKNDAMRGPSRMGILQSTAREFGFKGDIRDITPAQSEAIYKKIWDRSGAAGLPYPLSAIHFDTYVNSPAAARKILIQSGGNVNTYIALREQRYARLAELRPARFARYLDGWMNRISSLKNVACQHATLVAAQNAASAPTIKPKKLA